MSMFSEDYERLQAIVYDIKRVCDEWTETGEQSEKKLKKIGDIIKKMTQEEEKEKQESKENFQKRLEKINGEEQNEAHTLR